MGWSISPTSGPPSTIVVIRHVQRVRSYPFSHRSKPVESSSATHPYASKTIPEDLPSIHGVVWKISEIFSSRDPISIEPVRGGERPWQQRVAVAHPGCHVGCDGPIRIDRVERRLPPFSPPGSIGRSEAGLSGKPYRFRPFKSTARPGGSSSASLASLETLLSSCRPCKTEFGTRRAEEEGFAMAGKSIVRFPKSTDPARGGAYVAHAQTNRRQDPCTRRLIAIATQHGRTHVFGRHLPRMEAERMLSTRSWRHRRGLER